MLAVLERAGAVHLGDDERDPGLEPVGGRLVDRDRAAADGVRDELARGARADREEEDVDVAARERLGRRLLDRVAREPACPAERADAKTRTFSKPCSRRRPSVTVPTAPVPPTTPMRVRVRHRSKRSEGTPISRRSRQVPIAPRTSDARWSSVPMPRARDFGCSGRHGCRDFAAPSTSQHATTGTSACAGSRAFACYDDRGRAVHPEPRMRLRQPPAPGCVGLLGARMGGGWRRWVARAAQLGQISTSSRRGLGRG